MHTPASQAGPWRVGTFDHSHRRPRTSAADLEGHRLASVVYDLAHLSEAEDFGQNPRRGIELPNRQFDGPETPDPHLARNGALFPRYTPLYSFALVGGEPKSLPFRVGEVKVSAVFSFFDPIIIHAEILEPCGPPVERGAVGDAQFGSRDLACAGMVGGYAQMGPVEKSDLGPRVAHLVAVEKVVGR